MLVTYCREHMSNERIKVQKSTRRVLPARGVREVQEHVRFWVLISNLSKRNLKLPKNMLLAVSTKPPETIVAYNQMPLHQQRK